ncbi:hypothetical protein M2347_003082 [Chryseobacterium sp. H1D6B]|uniref:hypothetical protein n=1 Tax=Chryseobacterium sp. H1D6B TaxID=2940588 RepID=UPI0015CABDCC|nr:hypothetical protein [Chryseobacterium sp. H1D6B]MDH6253355.1 hypothetical protein [Chryseobacterium sp. H1D6B]
MTIVMIMLPPYCINLVNVLRKPAQINDALQTITEGNAGLKPTYADSFDLMFEKYFSNLGIISIGSLYNELFINCCKV